MSGLIFGAVAGVVLAIAGTSFSEAPWKFLFLVTCLCAAHFFTGGRT